LSVLGNNHFTISNTFGGNILKSDDTYIPNSDGHDSDPNGHNSGAAGYNQGSAL
jgi:hypothetical protein